MTKLRAFSLLALLYVTGALAQSIESTRQTPYDFACVDEAGNVLSSHQRQDKAIQSCSNRALAEPGKPFDVQGGRWRIVAEAAADVVIVAPPEEEPTNSAPVWNSTPSPIFTLGEASSYSLANAADTTDTGEDASDADGDGLTFANETGCTLPTGVSVDNTNDEIDYSGGGSAGDTTGCVFSVTDGTDSANSSAFTISITDTSAADTDFSERCAADGVVICEGFEDLSYMNANYFTRYAAQAGDSSIACDYNSNGNPCPQAYPNNIDPNLSLRYPAQDSSQAASGSNSLRVALNQVANQQQSGTLNIGEASGYTAWSETFGAGETIYFQIRIRYDETYTDNAGNSSASGGGSGQKQIILYGDGSCGQIETTIENSSYRGYPQLYTNCGGTPMYLCPEGQTTGNCGSHNNTYSPIGTLSNFYYQWGPNQPPSASNDTAALRDFEDDTNSTMWDGHHDKWWTYYIRVEISTTAAKHEMWVSRGGSEGMRQVIDYGPRSWTITDGPIRNLLLTQQSTSKSGTGVASTVWYDEVIISEEPIRVPYGVASGSHDVTCDDGERYIDECPTGL